jgi:hypothetical protein
LDTCWMGEHIVIDHTGNEECSVEEFMAAERPD